MEPAANGIGVGESPFVHQRKSSKRNYATSDVDADTDGDADLDAVLDSDNFEVDQEEALPEGWALWPLLMLPFGFYVGLTIQEINSGGNEVGAIGVLVWHVCFVLASIFASTRQASNPLIVFLLLVALAQPLFVETSSVVRQVHVLAWITHALRVSTLVNEPLEFGRRSWQMRVSFVHFFHNLRQTRRTTVWAELVAIAPRLAYSSLVAWMSLRTLHQYLAPPEKSLFVAALEVPHWAWNALRYVMGTMAFYAGI